MGKPDGTLNGFRIKQLHAMGDARNNPGFVHGDTIEAVANLNLVEARCNL